MTITFPFRPLSVNKLYAVDWKTKRRFLSKDAVSFKKQMNSIISDITFPVFDAYEIRIEVYLTDLFFKNGNLKRQDIDSYSKVIIDTLFQQVGDDDSKVVQLYISKQQSDKDYDYFTVSVKEVRIEKNIKK